MAPSYRSYANNGDRKARKAARKGTFDYNKYEAKKVLQKARQEAKEKAAAAASALVEKTIEENKA